MTLSRPICFWALVLAWGFSAFSACAQVYKGRTLVQAELIADTTAIVPGKAFRVGLLLRMAPRWHTYWQYAGDAGIATRIDWDLPDGFGAGPIEWPLPEGILEPGDIQVYAYGDEVMLITTLQPPANLEAGTSAVLKAKASWLVCEEICIPGKTDLQLGLPIASFGEAANADVFATYEALLPSADAPPFPVAWAVRDGELIGKVSPGGDVSAVHFYPIPPVGAEAGRPATEESGDGEFTVSIRAADGLPGVLAIDGPEGRRGWFVNAAAEPGSEIAPARTDAADAGAAGGITVWQALLFGMLGGLILNLMPCVLPVISLKIFGFINQAGEHPRRVMLHGLAFSAGIFSWFLGLGMVIAMLKASGSQVTWAFQFQNPWFNLAIATLVFVFALNLFGVFEVTLPGRATGAMSGAAGREGYGGSFFQGVFATLLATPCTAPFLGSALGFAFAQPPSFILAMFGAVSLGMALPYLILSARPGWMRFLPKPGAWMEKLKQFMGFPLLATLVWLLWILAGQKGTDGVLWTLAFLLGLGLACWIYGAFCGPLTSRGKRGVALGVTGVVVIGSGWVFLGSGFANAVASSAKGVAAADADGIPWIPYSKEKIDALIAEGKPVFIDFTADWCLTCKFNERTAIDREAVRKIIAEKGIVPVKADWTNSNPEITTALEAFGRVGVPFYVLYPAGDAENPVTLPELLTEQLVVRALSKAR